MLASEPIVPTGDEATVGASVPVSSGRVRDGKVSSPPIDGILFTYKHLRRVNAVGTARPTELTASKQNGAGR